MQNSITYNINNILKRLKIIHNIHSDIELAEIMRINSATISNWKNRNSINYDLIFESIRGKNINLHWLITGEGNMYFGESTGNKIIKEPEVEYKAKIDNKNEFEITIKIKPIKK